MTDQNCGKKIFILYPNSFISSEIIIPMIDKEYEIYTINDHKLIHLINNMFPESILFINIR